MSRKLQPNDILDILESGNVSEIDDLSDKEEEISEQNRPTHPIYTLDSDGNLHDLEDELLEENRQIGLLDDIIPDEELEEPVINILGDDTTNQVGLDSDNNILPTLDEPEPYRPTPSTSQAIQKQLPSCLHRPSTPTTSRLVRLRSRNNSPNITKIQNTAKNTSQAPVTPTQIISVEENPIENLHLTDKTEIVWLREPFPLTSFQNITVPNDTIESPVSEPITYFSKYITSDVIARMSHMTNLYATQKGVAFPFLSENETRIFLGLQITMGHLKFPRMRMYWEEGLRLPIFDCMNKNRFLSIRTNLHIIDNNEIPVGNKDRFVKVRPLYDALRSRFQELPVEESVCVDEQIVPFTGKLDVKQYIKNKPNPYGIKIFCLCGKSGIMYDFIIYQGPSTEFNNFMVRELGQSPTVVLQLAMKNLLFEPHKLFFDNFFNSYKLLEALKQLNIRAAGTVQVDRFGCMNSKKNIDTRPPLRTEKELKNLGRGTSDEIRSEDGSVVLVSWFDNKTVCLGSNFVGSGTPKKIKRWDKKTKEYVEVEIPEVIYEYNDKMGGVDKFDQLISYYRVFIKSKKWTLRMISHAIDMAIVNSWLEYIVDATRNGLPKRERLDLLHFRKSISSDLISLGQTVIQRKKRGRPSNEEQEAATSTKRVKEEQRPSTAIRKDTVDHLPQFDQKKDATRCKNKCCKGKTHVFCLKCNVHLCLSSKRNCFFEFHT